MKRILVDGEELNLYNDTDFEQTFQSFDVSNLTVAKSDRTTSINLPPTSKNKLLLGIEGDRSKRYSNVRADAIEDGVNVMPNAQCVVNEYAEDININLYRGAIDLFKIIGDDRLRDLDMSDLDHRRNRNNIFAARANTTGYVYPVVNYGKLEFGTRNLFTEYMLPSVYFSYIVNKIISRSGFAVTGRILSNQRYKETAIALTTVNSGVAVTPELQVGRSQLSSLPTYSGSATVPRYVLCNPDFDFSGTDLIPCFRQLAINGFGLPVTSVVLNSPQVVYYAPTSGLYKFTASATITAANISGTSVRFRLYAEQSAVTGTQSRMLTIGVAIQNGTFTYNISAEGRLRKGDKVTGIVEIPATAATPQEQITILFSNLICTEVTEVGDQPYGSIYDIAANMPEMKQVDFLKSVMGMFQVIPIIDPDSGTVNLWSFKDAYKDLGRAVDLSDRVNLLQSISRSTKIPGYAQSNLFKYSNSSEDDLDEAYGEGRLLVNDETIGEIETEIYEQPFSLSFQMYDALLSEVPVTALLHVFDTTDGTYLGDVNEPRVLLIKRLTASQNINFTDDQFGGIGATSTAISTGYVFFDVSGWYSLGYDDAVNVTGLLSNFFDGLSSLLDEAEIIECNMRIDINTIREINFRYPVYIREFQANFIINKISGYRDGFADVELIRM